MAGVKIRIQPKGKAKGAFALADVRGCAWMCVAGPLLWKGQLASGGGVT